MMEKIWKNKEQICFWLFVAIYGIYTLIKVIQHQPWMDEAMAWIIAEKANFHNYMVVTKNQGHFFIWYLLLLPFAKLHLFYPYSMTIMNWGFCFASLIIIWKLSPFNIPTKILISVTYPFLTLYPILARCYAIGILLFFILIAKFKDKIKHPITYSILIILLANTSAIATLAGLILGLFLLFDLSQNKQNKDFLICFGLSVFDIAIQYTQMFYVTYDTVPLRMMKGITWKFFTHSFNWLPMWVNITLLVLLVIGFLVCFIKDKKSLIFITSTFILLSLFFHFCYYGDIWHHYFYFIYLIGACWLFLENKNIDKKYQITISVLLCIVSFLLIFNKHLEDRIFNSNPKPVVNFIEQNKDAKMIILSTSFYSVYPYITPKYKNFEYIPSDDTHAVHFSKIYPFMDLKKDNYAIYEHCGLREYYQNEDGDKIIFKKVHIEKGVACFYKLEYVGKNK